MKQLEAETTHHVANQQPGPLARCERTGSATEEFDIGADATKLGADEQQAMKIPLQLQQPRARSLSQKRRSERFEGVAQSLHDAATALRRAVGRHLISGGASDDHSDTSERLPVDIVESPVGTRLQKENAELREELGVTSRKLTELQEEKHTFFDEGIYDIVNTVCRGPESTATAGQDEVTQALAQADTDLEAASRDLAVLVSAAAAGGHGEGGALEVLALRLRLREAEARADALAKENQELRRNSAA